MFIVHRWLCQLREYNNKRNDNDDKDNGNDDNINYYKNNSKYVTKLYLSKYINPMDN